MSPLRELYGGSFQHFPPQCPKLVVVMPALNEEATVGRAVRQIREALVNFVEPEIIVVDDGSVDRTVERARETGAKVISHRANEGLGVAIATGVDAALRAGADLIVTMDADGQFKGEDIPDLIQLLLDGRADMVIGSRYLREDYIPAGTSRLKLWASRTLAFVVSRVVWSKKLTDVTCGFRAYTRDATIRLSFLSRFTYTVESIIDAYYKGLWLTEVPIRARGTREHGKSRMTANFPLYAFGILVILLRRMRDIRPLMFFAMLTVGYVAGGASATALVATAWPHPDTRIAATIVAATGVLIFAMLTSIALLADQLHTTARIVHAIVRMQRIQVYNNPDLFRPVHRSDILRQFDAVTHSPIHQNGSDESPHYPLEYPYREAAERDPYVERVE